MGNTHVGWLFQQAGRRQERQRRWASPVRRRQGQGSCLQPPPPLRLSHARPTTCWGGGGGGLPPPREIPDPGRNHKTNSSRIFSSHFRERNSPPTLKQARKTEPSTPGLYSFNNLTGFGGFKFLIGFKHNKLLTERGDTGCIPLCLYRLGWGEQGGRGCWQGPAQLFQLDSASRVPRGLGRAPKGLQALGFSLSITASYPFTTKVQMPRQPQRLLQPSVPARRRSSAGLEATCCPSPGSG